MSYDKTISNTEDTLDVRDIIAVIEADEDNAPAELVALLDELRGNGGDEQWRGDWYPITLIRESYFEDYARELAEETGAVNPDATWPNNCIDWAEAADQLLGDYSLVDFDGVTYYYR